MDRRIRAQALAVAMVAMAASTNAALACGGCFSPPPPPGVSNARIVQDAERILFVQDPETKTSTVHVEVRFSGAPEDFGWVLPLPAQPTVGVGTRYIFDRLDQAAAPRLEVRALTGNEGCVAPNAGTSRSLGCGGFASADASAGEFLGGGGGLSGTPNEPDAVTVLDADQVGPYNYTVLTATDAAPLQQWLTDNGYEIPESSLPIIDDHLAKGDVFVAIKLARGEGVESIRPIVLQMPDTEACVPLRLTSIAASDDMQVIVYLAGPGRGVPKNMLHVVPNPLKLDWADGATNYPQVLSAAIDEAEGHAFATEFARPTSTASVEAVPGSFSVAQTTMFELPIDAFLQETSGEYPAMWQFWQGEPPADGPVAERLAREPYPTGALFDPARCDAAAIAAIAAVTDGASLQQALWETRLPIVIDSAQSLDAALPLTQIVGLSSTDINRISPVALWQRFALRFGFYEELSPELASRAVDGATLAAELDERFCAPIRDVHEQMGKAAWLTRLALRIDPTEMDRDPIFAFHADLPEVDPIQRVELNNVCTDGSSLPNATRFGFPAFGASYVVQGNGGSAGGSNARLPNDARFVTAPFAMTIELLDETQPEPMPIAPADIGLVDSAIASAQVGASSLPANLDVQPATEARWALPPSDADVSTTSASNSGDGCAARFGPRGMDALALVGLLAAVALTLGWRRRGRA